MEILNGSCHCDAVHFEVNCGGKLKGLRRCDCSLCSKKGAIMATALLSELQVTKGEDLLSLYQWNTKVAKHYFCSVCGIYTHHQRRSNPEEFGFNVACIDGIEPELLAGVEQADGKGSSVVEES